MFFRKISVLLPLVALSFNSFSKEYPSYDMLVKNKGQQHNANFVSPYTGLADTQIPTVNDYMRGFSKDYSLNGYSSLKDGLGSNECPTDAYHAVSNPNRERKLSVATLYQNREHAIGFIFGLSSAVDKLTLAKIEQLNQEQLSDARDVIEKKAKGHHTDGRPQLYATSFLYFYRSLACAIESGYENNLTTPYDILFALRQFNIDANFDLIAFDLEKNKDKPYVKRNVNGLNLSLKLINKSCPISNEKAHQVVKEYIKKEVNIKTESPGYPDAFEQAQTSCTRMLKDLVGYKAFWF